jgi:hypothetical protein
MQGVGKFARRCTGGYVDERTETHNNPDEVILEAGILNYFM